MSTTRVCRIGAFIIAFVASVASAQSVVFVRANLTSGANDGSSWADAFRGRLGLKAAIDSVAAGSGTEVWVAQGVYAPAGAGGDHEVSFQMKSGVALLGGFVGNESSSSARNPAANPTILSGDLNSNDGPDFTLMFDNSRHVVRATGADATALLDGFIVRDGGSFESFPSIKGTGAGLLVEGGAPTILNCTFIDCLAGEDGAGGALLGGASSRIEGCRFESNRAQGFGAGLYIDAGGMPSIRGCEFRSNFGSRGVGIFAFSAAPVIEDCLFFENNSRIGSVGGGGFYDRGGQSAVRRCDFIRNATVGGGGGVYVEGSTAVISQCRFIGNVGSFDVGDAAFVDGGSPTFISCLMRGNTLGTPTLVADASGCIVHVNNLVGPAHATFINCTLAGNGRGIFNGPAIAAVLVQGTCRADFINCVLWENTSFAGSGQDAALVTNLDAIATFDHCSVQGWTGTLAGMSSAALDPLFVDSNGADTVPGTLDDDVRLSAGSACIDSGSNPALPAGHTLDAQGQPRFRNDHETPDTGIGTAPIVDRGSLEFQPPPCLGDANDDGAVNFGDITFVLANWGAPFGFGDITQVLAAWGNPC